MAAVDLAPPSGGAAAPGAPRRARPLLGGAWGRLLLGIIGICLFLVVWESMQWVLPRSVRGFIAFPSQIAAYLPQLGGNPRQLTQIWTALVGSSAAFALGLGLAVVVGVLLGVIFGWYRGIGRIADRYMMILYLTPMVVLAPVFIIVFGIGLATPTAMVFVESVFPLYFVVSGAVVTADAGLARMARVFGASGPQVIRTIVIPSIVPAIASGLRQAIGRALVGLIVVEFFVGRGGIGGLILESIARGLPTLAFIGIAIFCLVNIVLVTLLQMVERRVEAWKPA